MRLSRFSRLARINKDYLARSCFYLKIRAALAVVIDNGELMFADRKRIEVIGFQWDNSRAGDCRIILRVNQRIVNLNACEFAEITVCTENKRFVAVLCPNSVCAFDNTIGRYVLCITLADFDVIAFVPPIIFLYIR